MLVFAIDANDVADNWVSVPTNSVVTVHKQTVLLHPIVDEFYSEDTNQDRSSCYAVSKGLVSTAPGTTIPPQKAAEVCGSSSASKNVRVGNELGLEVSRLGHTAGCAVSH